MNRINIGAGGFTCEGWINLDYVSDWYAHRQTLGFMPYDIRKDDLPFDALSVELAYCSHVIEHVELEHTARLFAEVFRTLKNGGIFRITCPDAEALYLATRYYPAFWEWRREWFHGKWRNFDVEEPEPLDFLVREVATPRCRQYTKSIDPFQPESLRPPFEALPLDEFLDTLVSGLEFRPDAPGDHIQWYSFDKLKSLLENAGFFVMRSRYGGCVNPAMQVSQFDVTTPQQSLYVDAIKIST